MEAVPSTLDPAMVPQHVAIIMDGNGRWAKARGLPRSAGHKRGVEAVRRVVEAAVEFNVRYLTLFGFSSENWKRPKLEVDTLMGLLRIYLRSDVAEMHKEGVRLRVVGERSRLDADIVKMIEDAEALTAENTRINVTIALSYGGRQEIARAAQLLAEEVASGRLRPDEIDETRFAQRLFAPEIPDPDLLIRTSGEQRISNFLLWQLAYSELVFTETLWPDFSRLDLEQAIRDFNGRERRYGAAVG